MNHYQEQAKQDVLNYFATFLIESYSSAEELDEAVASGNFDSNIYVENNSVQEIIATFRIEPGEGKVFFDEGSTWVVWYHDILNRWYGENQEFIDKEVSNLLCCA